MPRKLAKVKEREGLAKDLESGAVLSTDVDALVMYRQAREQRIKIQARYALDLEETKLELAEVKEMLNMLVQEMKEQNARSSS